MIYEALIIEHRTCTARSGFEPASPVF